MQWGRPEEARQHQRFQSRYREAALAVFLNRAFLNERKAASERLLLALDR